MVQPWEKAITTLHYCFPAIASRIFYHDDQSSQALAEWKASSLPDHGRLADEFDETVDHTGFRTVDLYNTSEDEVKSIFGPNANEEDQSGDVHIDLNKTISVEETD